MKIWKLLKTYIHEKKFLSLISITFSLMLQSQGIIGAWEGSSTSKNGELLKTDVSIKFFIT